MAATSQIFSSEFVFTCPITWGNFEECPLPGFNLAGAVGFGLVGLPLACQSPLVGFNLAACSF
jgi:hypothetical protein